jgi:hypothetical protein
METLSGALFMDYFGSRWENICRETKELNGERTEVLQKYFEKNVKTEKIVKKEKDKNLNLNLNL